MGTNFEYAILDNFAKYQVKNQKQNKIPKNYINIFRKFDVFVDLWNPQILHSFPCFFLKDKREFKIGQIGMSYDLKTRFRRGCRPRAPSWVLWENFNLQPHPKQNPTLMIH